MHSRFALVLLLIAALFGMAMHTAVDVAHAADATHATCSDVADNSADADDSDGTAKDVQHCCAAACHGWAQAPVLSFSFIGVTARDNVSIYTKQLASSVSDGLRRPPRLLSETQL